MTLVAVRRPTGVGPPSSVPYVVEQNVPIFADMFDLAERGASYCRSSLNCYSFPQHIVSPFLRLSSISNYNGENQQRLEYSASLVQEDKQAAAAGPRQTSTRDVTNLAHAAFPVNRVFSD